MTLIQIYEELLKAYGSQGWWPIINNKTLLCEYHTGAPKNDAERFEICIGAVLTQNTQWYPNVVKALVNLKQNDLLSANKILSCDELILIESIKPAGYYNQKAKKLKITAEFFLGLHGKAPSRDQLLALWGIGPETADSILLYAYNIPSFVVDAYTKKILVCHNLISENAKYDEIKQLFETQLPKNAALYNECHALIVEHAKKSCKVKQECEKCVLNRHSLLVQV